MIRLKLLRVAKNFFDIKVPIEVVPYGSGNINDTYLVVLDEIGEKEKYLMQKINSFVFKDVTRLIKNIELVTDYIYDNFPNVVQLKIIRTIEGEPFHFDVETKSYWRMYTFINDGIGYDIITDKKQFYELGSAFGDFQKMLNDFPIENLHETIPNFHNTKYRFDHFLKNIQLNKANRVNLVKEEINFLLEREHYASIIVDLLDKGIIPLRVTHNDTNNVLINTKTARAVAVIDLDTVMPGSILYDYGDAIRYGANNALEDEPDLRKVSLSLELFTSFTKSFIKETASILTASEVENLVNGVLVITFELAMRFLEDYINGDEYFKTKYKDHNLVRARTQITLLKDMETKVDEMNKIVYKYYERYKIR